MSQREILSEAKDGNAKYSPLIGMIPNIPENIRNRKTTKRGRKRHYRPEVYIRRFVSERSFAWIDVFKTLLVRFEGKAVYCLGFHHLAFTFINLRNLLAKV